MRRAFTLLEFIVVIVIILILAAILFPVFSRAICRETSGPCRTNLKKIHTGFLQYIQDYDECFPLAHVTPTTGWANVSKT